WRWAFLRVGEVLIVVLPKNGSLYEYLRRRLAGVKGVKVIPERRQADRRREQRPVGDERLQKDRRIRQGKIFALGYTLFRFKRKSPPGRCELNPKPNGGQ